MQELRYAIRTLRRNPAFSAVAIVTLALGIGANSAMFSVISGVLLRPLPYARDEQLVLLEQRTSIDESGHPGVSVQEFDDYRAHVRTLSGIVEYHSLWFTLLDRGEPERVQSGIVSWDFFQLMGVEPLLGRLFLPAENSVDADPVLILGYEFWRTRYGSDPGVIGRSVEMNDRFHTIVGVLPPLPRFPGNNDVWMPWYACPFRTGDGWRQNREWRALDVIGRVKPGIPIEAARADIARIAHGMKTEHPDIYPPASEFRADLVPIRDALTREARPVFLTLLGMAGCILLIACANVANLSVAHMAGREQEMAVRSALGASRGRLMRQILTESTLLAMTGGTLGLFVAVYATDALALFAARFTPHAGDVGVDHRVLLFTLGVSLATGLIIGTAAAILFARKISPSLREGSGRATAGMFRQRVRGALVAAQVGATVILLAGAGLMLRSFVELRNVNPGFIIENVLTMQIDLDWAAYRDPARRNAFYLQLLERTNALPGVRYAGLAGYIPLDGGLPTTPFQIEGRPVADERTGPRTDYQVVSARYFDALGIPVVRGRSFTDQDANREAAVVVISQSIARQYWGTDDPIGARISDDGTHWATVIGVVGDVKQDGLEQEYSQQVYLPLDMDPPFGARLLIRTTSDPMAVARDAAAAVHSIDPRQPVAFVRTLADIHGESLSARRLATLLLGMFAALALAISIAGIAALMAFAVSQRTQELGIRIALGADSGRVLWLVARQAVGFVGIGLLAGLVAILALGRFITGWLYEIAPTDPVTLIGVCLLLLAAALLAACVPARRATQIDPITALRTD